MAVQVPAGFLAKVTSEQATQNWHFLVATLGGGFSIQGDINSAVVNGSWDLLTVPIIEDEIQWSGADPAITNNTGNERDANLLKVARGSSENVNEQMVVINFNPVTLQAGDTIIFTSIKVSFSTGL